MKTIHIPEWYGELSEAGKLKAVERRMAKAGGAKTRKVLLQGVSSAIIAALALCIGMAVKPLTVTPPEPETVTVYQTIHDRDAWDITADEQAMVACVVSAMARGENTLTMEAVAQSVRNACEVKDLTVVEAIEWGKYPIAQENIGQSAKDAVARVVAGYNAVDDIILYSYNPKVQEGSWHENQNFVCQIGNLRFFN